MKTGIQFMDRTKNWLQTRSSREQISLSLAVMQIQSTNIILSYKSVSGRGTCAPVSHGWRRHWLDTFSILTSESMQTYSS